ncbi:MAG: hypothetical protein WCW87_03120 [Candidatus Paceibacterota bacterium]
MIIFAEGLGDRYPIIPCSVARWLFERSWQNLKVVCEIDWDPAPQVAILDYEKVLCRYSKIYYFNEEGGCTRVLFLYEKQVWIVDIVGKYTVGDNFLIPIPVCIRREDLKPLSFQERNYFSGLNNIKYLRPIGKHRLKNETASIVSDGYSLIAVHAKWKKNGIQEEDFI